MIFSDCFGVRFEFVISKWSKMTNYCESYCMSHTVLLIQYDSLNVLTKSVENVCQTFDIVLTDAPNRDLFILWYYYPIRRKENHWWFFSVLFHKVIRGLIYKWIIWAILSIYILYGPTNIAHFDHGCPYVFWYAIPICNSPYGLTCL